MRVLIAESDLEQRICLSIWLAKVGSSELAGLARSRKELLPAIRVSNADIIVASWDLLASDFDALLKEFRALQPVPKIIIVSWQTELDEMLLNRGVDAVIQLSELPQALYAVLEHMKLEVDAIK